LGMTMCSGKLPGRIMCDGFQHVAIPQMDMPVIGATDSDLISHKAAMGFQLSGRMLTCNI